MNVIFHKLIDELSKLGLHRGYHDAGYEKYGFGDCKSTFIAIYKQTIPPNCTVYCNLHITKDGEFYTDSSRIYVIENDFDEIIAEMKKLITEYKELKVKYKKQQIEKDFE